jgi:hypothetical protein
MSAPQQSDKSAGFTGLILGAIAIFVLMFGIVRMTNSHYNNLEQAEAGHGAEAPK